MSVKHLILFGHYQIMKQVIRIPMHALHIPLTTKQDKDIPCGVYSCYYQLSEQYHKLAREDK